MDTEPQVDRALTVGVLQFAPQRRSLRKNIDFIRRQVRRLSDAIVVLPEFFLGSYTDHPLFFLPEAELNAVLAPLLELTQERTVSLVGSLPIESNGRTFNRAVLIHEGEVQTVYDKARLFGDEKHIFHLGESNAATISINGVKCSVRICMDIFDPLPSEESGEVLLILGPSAVSVDHLRTIHKARALENQAMSVFCNRSGEDPWSLTQYLGRSTIFHPDGNEDELDGVSEELKTVELGPAEIRTIAASKLTFKVNRANARERA